MTTNQDPPDLSNGQFRSIVTSSGKRIYYDENGTQQTSVGATINSNLFNEGGQTKIAQGNCPQTPKGTPGGKKYQE
jgi:hypothetical protein